MGIIARFIQDSWIEHPYLGAAACLVAAIIWLSMVRQLFYFQKPKKPELICKAGPFRDRLLQNMSDLHTEFRALFWSKSGAIQNAMYMFGPNSRNYVKEVIVTRGGNSLALLWQKDTASVPGLQEANQKCKPVIAFLPGLAQNSRSIFLEYLLQTTCTKGYRSVVINYPGGDDVPMTGLDLFFSPDGTDMDSVVDHIRKCTNNDPLMLVGASLGAVTILNYLITHPQQSAEKVAGTVGISTPFDEAKVHSFFTDSLVGKLASCSTSLFYQKLIKKNRKFLETRLDRGFIDDALKFPITYAAFTERYSANFNGLTLQEYREAFNGRGPKLSKVKVPFLSINAEDDPFIYREGIPFKDVEASSNVAVILTETGGHCSFMDRWMMSKKPYFLSRVLTQYAAMIFGNKI